jgi:hypothetical protein
MQRSSAASGVVKYKCDSRDNIFQIRKVLSTDFNNLATFNS